MELHLRVSLVILDHTVLPATWPKWTHPTLTSARQANTRFTYPRGMEGWVDIDGWVHTKMVYLSTDSHPSTGPDVEQLDQDQHVNHYTRSCHGEIWVFEWRQRDIKTSQFHGLPHGGSTIRRLPSLSCELAVDNGYATAFYCRSMDCLMVNGGRGKGREMCLVVGGMVVGVQTFLAIALV